MQEKNLSLVLLLLLFDQIVFFDPRLMKCEVELRSTLKPFSLSNFQTTYSSAKPRHVLFYYSTSITNENHCSIKLLCIVPCYPSVGIKNTKIIFLAFDHVIITSIKYLINKPYISKHCNVEFIYISANLLNSSLSIINIHKINSKNLRFYIKISS